MSQIDTDMMTNTQYYYFIEKIYIVLQYVQEKMMAANPLGALGG